MHYWSQLEAVRPHSAGLTGRDRQIEGTCQLRLPFPRQFGGICGDINLTLFIGSPQVHTRAYKIILSTWGRVREGAMEQEAEGVQTTPAKPGPSRRAQKRRRRKSNETSNQKKSGDDAVLEEGGGGGGGGGGGEKRPRNRLLSISSKTVANHVMKTRLLGSESDPLNLEGVGTGGEATPTGCSAMQALSPVFSGGQAVLPRPPLLQNPRDPLNLEGFLPENRSVKLGECVHERERERERTAEKLYVCSVCA